MLEIDRVFELINNHDAREALRRYAPAWAIVVVNSALKVETVQRFREKPSIDEVDSLMALHTGCAYFYTRPNMYQTRDALRLKVAACAEAFGTP